MMTGLKQLRIKNHFRRKGLLNRSKIYKKILILVRLVMFKLQLQNYNNSPIFKITFFKPNRILPQYYFIVIFY